MPPQITEACRSCPALKATVATLELLGYTFRPSARKSTFQSGPTIFIGSNTFAGFPILYLDVSDPIGDVVIFWPSDDCEDERIPRTWLQQESRGREAALRAVACAIAAARAARITS